MSIVFWIAIILFALAIAIALVRVATAKVLASLLGILSTIALSRILTRGYR
jgi:multisubunit Na+/H+ antiporter MnhF subunit